MRSIYSKGYFPLVVAFLLASWSAAIAQHPDTHQAKGWLDNAVSEKHCPLTPVNVQGGSGENSGKDLLKRIKISDHKLVIEGTDDPDHIVIKSDRDASLVYVKWNGMQLGRFGPVSGVTLRGGGGDDVLIVKRSVTLPVVLDGGGGDDCLQGGSGGDQLLGGDGDDVLIAGTGRPALFGGTGKDRVIVPNTMGTLHYGPSADAGILRSLHSIYDLQPVGDEASVSSSSPGPLVLGASDLGNEQMLKAAKRARAAGEAVVVTEATQAQSEQLRLALGHPNAANVPGHKPESKLPLVHFRTARRPGTKTFDYTAGYFTEIPGTLEDGSTQLLSRVFSATAVVPEVPGDSASNDLRKLANSYTTSVVSQKPSGDSVHIVNSVWAVRSFLNQADFYYVFQEADYRNAETALFGVTDAAKNLISLSQAPDLIQPSPQTTHCSNSTTSGVTWDIGGSAGWSGAQGLNAALTGGVSVTNSTTITCPSTLITNKSNPNNGETEWGYLLFNPSPPAGNLASFYNQWIWEVPFSSYPSGAQNIAITSTAFQGFNNGPALVATLDSTVPFPFGSTFALQSPVVSSVNPTCVNAGNTFTINGSGFYPSLVSSVLIDGTTLSSGAYSALSDTSIKVIAPEQSGYYLPVVVQTGQDVSNSNVTIEISTFGECP